MATSGNFWALQKLEENWALCFLAHSIHCLHICILSSSSRKDISSRRQRTPHWKTRRGSNKPERTRNKYTQKKILTKGNERDYNRTKKAKADGAKQTFGSHKLSAPACHSTHPSPFHLLSTSVLIKHVASPLCMPRNLLSAQKNGWGYQRYSKTPSIECRKTPSPGMLKKNPFVCLGIYCQYAILIKYKIACWRNFEVG
jgi:hypothetical protein